MGSKQLKLKKESKEVCVAFVVQFDRSVYNQYHCLIIVFISVVAITVKSQPWKIQNTRQKYPHNQVPACIQFSYFHDILEQNVYLKFLKSRDKCILE